MLVNQLNSNQNSVVSPAGVGTCAAGPSGGLAACGSKHRAERVLEKFFFVTLHRCFTSVNLYFKVIYKEFDVWFLR